MLDIPVLDHVVIGEGESYWSMREHFNNDDCHRPALDNCGWWLTVPCAQATGAASVLAGRHWPSDARAIGGASARVTHRA